MYTKIRIIENGKFSFKYILDPHTYVKSPVIYFTPPYVWYVINFREESNTKGA